MKDDDLDALAELTGALYQAEAARMRQLLADERRLREGLARLEAQYAANRTLPEPELNGLRQIGGDMIWQGWASRKKAELQSELARVLGYKGQTIARLRRAYGKSHAVDRMMDAKRARQIASNRALHQETRAQLGLLDKWVVSD